MNGESLINPGIPLSQYEIVGGPLFGAIPMGYFGFDIKHFQKHGKWPERTGSGPRIQLRRPTT